MSTERRERYARRHWTLMDSYDQRRKA